MFSMPAHLSKLFRHRHFARYFASCRHHSLKTKSGTFNYCLDLVQKNDYENFLCSLLLPKHFRSHALILRAFNVELASVADQVRENVIGQMRFQFWEDTLNRIYTGTVPEHPVCQQLAKLIHTGKVSKVYLNRLILARRNHLRKQFTSLNEAEDYSDWSNTSLYLSLLELGDVRSLDADHAASHLGKAQGLCNMLRSTPQHSQKNHVILPQELLLKYSVTQEDILRCKTDVRVKSISYEIAGLIRKHLDQVDHILKKIDRKTRTVFLPAVPIRCYLKRLSEVDFNVFDETLRQKQQMLSLILLRKRIIL